MTKSRILIVDDQAPVVAMIARLLTSFDYEVLGPADCSEAAIRLAAQLRPDLVLMDVNLAGEVDGITVAETIRTRFGIRSVLITGLEITAVLPRAQSASPVGFLNKPFSGSTLHTTIQMALHLRDVQAQFQHNQQTLAAILQTAPDGLLVTDLQGRTIEANDAACRLLGRPRAGLVGCPLAGWMPRGGGEHETAMVEQQLAARVRRFSHTCPGAHGRLLELTFCAQLENLASDRFVCFLRDITEERQQKKKLRTLLRAVEQSPVSIVITDAKGNIEYVNPRFGEVTGYTTAEAFGQNPRILKTDEHSPEFYRGLWATILDGREWHGELCNRRKNGARFWEQASISPIRDDAGRVTHFVAVKEDITARKEAEARLLQSKVQLEDANAQLTAAVAREQKLAAAAEQASEAKSAFLASMSHELRTPLNVINGTSATMMREFAGTKPAETAGLILGCGEHLLGIISQILDFSVLQGNHAKLEAKPFDLLPVVSSVLRQIAVSAREKPLVLSLWIAPSTPTGVEGDPQRLQQILLNLLQNAVKFTKFGGVHLSVSARRLDRNRWRWSFSVADSGIGICREDLAKLFQPFAQANGGISHTYGGTGLGLAIARSFARLMGGDIVVRSRPGRGSCFRCSIVAREAEPHGRTVANLGAPALRGRSLRIVARGSRTRRLLGAMTKAWGMHPGIYSGDQWSRCSPPNAESPELGIFECGECTIPPTMVAPMVWLERTGSGDSGQRPAGRVLLQPPDLRELSRALEDAISPPAANAPPATPTTKAGRLADRVPLRILAADDIRTNREALRGMLEYFGYRPDFCADGAEVLAALARQSYDLVLLDVQMPVMDGLTAAREIVRLQPDAAKRPRLVAVTANALRGDRETCLAAGMDDYLTKPVLPDHIEAGVLRWFSACNAASPPLGPTARNGSETAPPLIDRAHLAAAFPGIAGPQLGEILLQMEAAVRTDFETAMTCLEEACVRRDAPAVATALHALKGCFLTIGWQRMAVQCEVALRSARENRFDEWTSLPGVLRRLYAVSGAAMAQHREELAQIVSATIKIQVPVEMRR